MPVLDIAKKLTIKTGKNAGSSPSVAFLYRALAEAEQAAADACGSPLRGRLQEQVLQRLAGESL